jgi:hypothetical protein
MLTDQITLADSEAADHVYTLSFREGYNSIRREDGVSSDQGSALEVKNTIDISSTKPNRHLIKVTCAWQDEVTGIYERVTAHCVITRDKGLSDADVISVVTRLGDFLVDDAMVAKVLLGES